MNNGKQPPEGGHYPAESAEQRGLTKGNTPNPTTAGTQRPGKVSSGLERVREMSRRDRRVQFTALLHHIDVPLLWESYERLKRKAAPGVDGVRWADYQNDLLVNLTDLTLGYTRAATVLCQASVRALPKKMAAFANLALRHWRTRLSNRR